MIKRIGHMTMRVADLDRAVEHHIEVLGLTETERRGEVAYMTCNDRHHELILVAGDAPAYEQVGLEVE